MSVDLRPVRHLPAPIAAAFEAAVAAAAAFRGATAPNPTVGCAVLDDEGGLLAVAAHERAGQAHAEAAALARCREQGSTERIRSLVVTLEPCNHHGRTPPCTQAILATPAATIWIGAADPNPQVRGGGAARLAAAGRTVHALADVSGPAAAHLSRACMALLDPFAKRVLTGRPWVTVKQALDPEGSMIPPPGRTTFTSAAALTYAHELRRRADAILTGSGTILADDPAFTVRRVPDHAGKRRMLVILDRRGRVPRAYATAATGRGFDVVIERDLDAALDRLGRAGALEVLVEAGPTVTAQVLERSLWDEHVIVRAGRDAAAESIETVRRDGGAAMSRVGYGDVG